MRQSDKRQEQRLHYGDKLPAISKEVLGKNMHWLLLVGGIALLGAVFSIMPDDAKATRSPDTSRINTPAGEQKISLDIPIPADTDKAQPDTLSAQDGEWHTVTVKPGESLSVLFARKDLSPQELYKLTSNKTAAKQLKRLYPGDDLKLRIDDKTLTELVYDYDIAHSLHMRRQGDSFEARVIDKPLEYRTARATGIINDSLFLSAQRAGMSDKLTMELAGIFGWDVDFALDIRQGDSFAVIYEEIFLNGEKVRDGKIIAAAFTNRGKTYQAIRYTDAENRTGYFSPDGRSMRKAFLRTPVEFSRISSRFNLSRKHPVLNKIRAHRGVDYAASSGTPIKATGDGKVIHKGTKGGYGRTVIIQHGSSYSTLYAHMSKYARGVRSGKRVKQGQIIGYVGKSGLATGPHLHYEFRVNGAHRNPLTVKLPDAQPLAKKYMADFKRTAPPLLASLELLKRTNITLAQQ